MTRIKTDHRCAALFDLDGVLIDSETVYTRFWSEMGRKFRPDVPTLATDIKGTTLTHILGTYFKPDTHAYIKERLDELERTMPFDLKPGVMDLLASLTERNVPAVMVTSSNEQKMTSLWTRQPELRGFFKGIVTADMIRHSKPDPEGYLTGAAIAGVPARNCVVFEDSEQGVMAGHRAGAYVVGVAGTLPAAVIAPYSDRVVSTLENFNVPELIDILTSRIDIPASSMDSPTSNMDSPTSRTEP